MAEALERNVRNLQELEEKFKALKGLVHNTQGAMAPCSNIIAHGVGTCKINTPAAMWAPRPRGDRW